VERWSLTATSEQVADQVTVQPGDPVATAEAEDWLKDYANGRDAAVRERIILAYLGLADRIASRYRALARMRAQLVEP
jgi:hypothetical protein